MIDFIILVGVFILLTTVAIVWWQHIKQEIEMKLKVIETKETIWELPDNYFDDKDYNEEDLSDDEVASCYQEGKKLWEETTEIDIAYNSTVFNYKSNKYEEIE